MSQKIKQRKTRINTVHHGKQSRIFQTFPSKFGNIKLNIRNNSKITPNMKYQVVPNKKYKAKGLYTGLSIPRIQGVVVQDTYEEFNDRLKSIENEQKMINKKIGDISEILSQSFPNRQASNESITLFFPNMIEFNTKVLSFLKQQQIDYELRDGGIIIVEKSNLNKIKNARFIYIQAKNTNEIYKKYPQELKDYTQQVRKSYGLPER